jgi:hypothetical protein
MSEETTPTTRTFVIEVQCSEGKDDFDDSYYAFFGILKLLDKLELSQEDNERIFKSLCIFLNIELTR